MRFALWFALGLASVALATCGGRTAPCFAAEPPAGKPSAAGEAQFRKSLADRSQRGTLHDAALVVRGDTGRWNDEEIWLRAPTPAPSTARLALDDWVETWAAKKQEPTSADDNWLFLRTRQLSDNDRVWVESIERNGNRLTVVLHQATWRGKYFKDFTYYQVLGVNFGRLPPGDYEAICVLVPLTFTTFDGSGKPQDNVAGKPPQINWPKEEQPADQKPRELTIRFAVTEK